MPLKYNTRLNSHSIMGVCMSGTIGRYKKSWYVRWWDKKAQTDIKIYRYKGFKLETRAFAEKLLRAMQEDVEKGTFYIEKYTQSGFSGVVPFIDQWLENAEDLSPATYKGYRSYVENHLRPFFQKHSQLDLPDIQLDVLEKLRKSLKEKGLSPKTQINIMYAMHLILDEAKRSHRITHMPSFPKKRQYQYSKKPIQWLPEDRQLAIIESIPEEHRPIFYFLKYHLRRPAEACALHKEDYYDGVFTIHRSVSARELTQKTKTGEIHTIPCHPDFEKYIAIEAEKQKLYGIFSPFFFINPQAR